eukprot:768464-Hanusia_phi.AAC.1
MIPKDVKFKKRLINVLECYYGHQFCAKLEQSMSVTAEEVKQGRRGEEDHREQGEEEGVEDGEHVEERGEEERPGGSSTTRGGRRAGERKVARDQKEDKERVEPLTRTKRLTFINELFSSQAGERRRGEEEEKKKLSFNEALRQLRQLMQKQEILPSEFRLARFKLASIEAELRRKPGEQQGEGGGRRKEELLPKLPKCKGMRPKRLVNPIIVDAQRRMRQVFSDAVESFLFFNMRGTNAVSSNDLKRGWERLRDYEVDHRSLFLAVKAEDNEQSDTIGFLHFLRCGVSE